MSESEATYDPHGIVDKWLPVWERLGVYEAADADDPRPRSYVVDMFPYPSGDLHMGHAEAFSIGDAVARFEMMRGRNVLHPIGWDSFGLPAENAAIKRGLDPRDWTYDNIETQAESFRRFGISFDWRTRLHTSDPEYYRWTQWLFLRLYERGLAYRKAAPVNWCPNDQTVLANEQVDPGSLRALRHRGHQEEPDPVVLQDHRLRGAAAGRHGAAGGQVAGPRADHAAQLDRPVHRGARRLPHRGPRRARTGVHHPAGHAVRRDVLRRRRRLAAGRGAGHHRPARGVRDVRGAGAVGDRDRAAGQRPAEDRRVPGPACGQPGQRRADPGVRGGLRAGGVRHRRHHGRPRARPA